MWNYMLEVLAGWTGIVGAFTFAMDLVMRGVHSQGKFLAWIQKVHVFRWLLAGIFLFAQFQAYERVKADRDGAVQDAERAREVEIRWLNREIDRLSKLADASGSHSQELETRITTSASAIATRDRSVELRDAEIFSLRKSLGEAQREAPLKFRFIEAPPQPSPTSGAAHAETFIVLTNKTVSPVRNVLVCKGELKSALGEILGMGGMSSATPNRLAPNAFLIEVQSPAWSPELALAITIEYDDDPLPCNLLP
jgi:hypothetical protein